MKQKWRPSFSAGNIIVFVVCVATGGLFAASALSSDNNPQNLELDLPNLVADRQENILLAEATNQELQDRVNELVQVTESTEPSGESEALYDRELVGPGVAVKLTDAPVDLEVGPEVNPNDLVVHQEDVNAVMNSLWRGGAEAMAVQGLRITPRTPVRCIGNVILVGGNVFSPPYRIEAIGNPPELLAALDADPQLEIYQQYVRAYGIGWGVEEFTELVIPPLSEGLSFKMAKVIEEDPV